MTLSKSAAMKCAFGENPKGAYKGKGCGTRIAIAGKRGMDPFAALQSITINPAKRIGVADRVSSIEVGKDGDIVLTDGDIMANTTRVLSVFLNGEKVV